MSRMSRKAANEILSALKLGKVRPSQKAIAAALVVTGDLEPSIPVRRNERRAAMRLGRSH